MAYTKEEIKKLAVISPMPNFVTGSPVSIVAGDQVEVAFEKTQANINQLQTQVGTIQVGNNLFNYYNFK